MDFATCFPVWDKLTTEEQTLLSGRVFEKTIPAGTILHQSGADCMGLVLLRSGQFRAYILSDQGREITIYRLFDRDMCLLSASCIMRSIQFDISISAEKDTDVWVIPTDVYQELMEKSAAMANYITEVMGTRLTDVMWLLEQIMWKSFDKRLAAFLAEECRIENSDTLKITHEQIAAHLGSAREVVTRMLTYFQSEGIVELTRGKIRILDHKRLNDIDQ